MRILLLFLIFTVLAGCATAPMTRLAGAVSAVKRPLTRAQSDAAAAKSTAASLPTSAMATRLQAIISRVCADIAQALRGSNRLAARARQSDAAQVAQAKRITALQAQITKLRHGQFLAVSVAGAGLGLLMVAGGVAALLLLPAAHPLAFAVIAGGVALICMSVLLGAYPWALAIGGAVGAIGLVGYLIFEAVRRPAPVKKILKPL